MDTPKDKNPAENNLKRFLDDHVGRLTCHGVADIYASTSWATKVVWFACFGAALAFVVTGVIGIVNDYLDQTIVTTYTYVDANQ